MGCARFENCLQLTSIHFNFFFSIFFFGFRSRVAFCSLQCGTSEWLLSRILEVRICEEDWDEILHRATTAGLLVDGRLDYAEVVKIMAMWKSVPWRSMTNERDGFGLRSTARPETGTRGMRPWSQCKRQDNKCRWGRVLGCGQRMHFLSFSSKDMHPKWQF